MVRNFFRCSFMHDGHVRSCRPYCFIIPAAGNATAVRHHASVVLHSKKSRFSGHGARVRSIVLPYPQDWDKASVMGPVLKPFSRLRCCSRRGKLDSIIYWWLYFRPLSPLVIAMNASAHAHIARWNSPVRSEICDECKYGGGLEPDREKRYG